MILWNTETVTNAVLCYDTDDETEIPSLMLLSVDRNKFSTRPRCKCLLDS